ncbi:MULTISPECIES: adenylosuccinate lyase [unclassified Gemella]|uniref:adenylosuccinate lyase n=1 Tax=unclassified Gemella TaxID=2624949 RepID=UPI0010744C00|nr:MULTISPECIES: adenylosuccinate lyase [unclassified Gemella]MBF0710191.1 adenylosuccinate lyase [Gemella sp. GL1.1]MBF0746491.1 adenylosuccinate lyase [Gemella sp. 19428wG2_WT2a]NYS27535.1 adenylosuccinate lyase [Gemella sp. GL1]TFU60271.1 adenylosuccinate lyase [Gemella sp. WT2a]
MIERYSTKEMQEIWSEENKFRAWLEVEILACEGWANLGEIPKEDVIKLRENASFDLNRIYEIEEETRHDVIAFTRAVSETLGEEKKWVHYGLTSTDVVDTAYGYLYKQANTIIRQKIVRLIEVLKEKSFAYKNTFMMGRTHGVHAEITTFGLKMALWYEEMKRNLERFDFAAEQVEAGKISGAVGTYANIPTHIQDYVCEKLGINSSKISTQVLQRDRHAHYYSTLALIASSIEKFAVEIRHLQRTEVREVEEFFRKGQKGSSAMPHKRNPISSENLSGLARVIRGYMLTSFENVALWHERDISHSSTERIISADATNLIDYQLTRFTNTLENLTVFDENMKENINKTYGVIFSQRIMLKLIEKGISRERAYDTVQPKAMHAWENKIFFKDLLLKDEEIMKYITVDELDDCFNYQYHISSLEEVYERVFGK